MEYDLNMSTVQKNLMRADIGSRKLMTSQQIVAESQSYAIIALKSIIDSNADKAGYWAGRAYRTARFAEYVQALEGKLNHD